MAEGAPLSSEMLAVHQGLERACQQILLLITGQLTAQLGSPSLLLKVKPA